jgi:hypothetical protein
MPFDARIRELCNQLADCRDDAVSLSLAQELQIVLHERIEQLRGEVQACHCSPDTAKRRRKRELLPWLKIQVPIHDDGKRK